MLSENQRVLKQATIAVRSRQMTRVHQICHLHYMKRYVGVEVQLHAFLTSALDGGEWSAPRPGRFTPKKTKLRGLSPRADYTDRAAAAGRRS